MHKSVGVRLLAGLLSCLVAQAGQNFDVKIIGRRDSQTGYSYVVPGHSNAVSNTDLNCYGSESHVNCSGSTTTTGTTMPPRWIAYNVTGATLSLQLPDGRIAVVNCESKANWTEFSKPNQHRRSCRIPLVNEIHAEFDGNKAKLEWSVSIDGKKFESETYKILALLDASNRQNDRVDAESTAAKTTPSTQKEAEVVTAKTSPLSPPAPPKDITVRFTSTPSGAEVDVDGNYWGTTPTRELTRLPVGTHTIVVKKIGYKPWERKIDLASGDDRTVNAELEIDPTKPHISGLN
jgi:hypothetical protein